MNLTPPPRTDNLLEMQQWMEDLYQYLQYPVFATAKLLPRSAAPTAEEGRVYYDSDDNAILVYNGTEWRYLLDSADQTSPIFVGITLTGLTASRIMATDADKAAESIDLEDWVFGVENQIDASEAEYYPSYALTDAPGKVTVEPHKITLTDGDRDEDYYATRDMGAGFFTDFVHEVDVNVTALTSGGDCAMFPWAISDSNDDLKDIEDLSGSLIAVIAARQASNTHYKVGSIDVDSGSISFNHGTAAIAVGTKVFLTVSRSSTSLTVDVYSTDALRSAGSIGGGDIDTTASTVVSDAFQYVYGIASNNRGIAGLDISGTIENLSIRRGTVTVSRPEEVTDQKMTIDQELILSPSPTTDVTAAGGITPTRPVMRIQGSGGAVDITADPQITAGSDGQRITLIGSSDGNSVTLENGTGVHLHDKAIMADHDALTLLYHANDSQWEEESRNFSAKEVSWAFDSPGGTTGDFYFAGFYDHGASANDFNPSINHGVISCSNAAHFFLVQAAGASGGTDTVIRVTGTTIDDQGNRTAAVDVDITVADDGAAGTYYETTQKFLGRVSVTKQSGPDLLCNYGFAKYWDNNNTDYRVMGLEAVWLAGANDTGANIIAVHHHPTGWTYNAGAPADHPPNMADMNTDHVVEKNLVNNENGAWKRDNLTTTIAGSSQEGFMIHIVTSANKAFEQGTFILRVRPS